MSPTRTPANPAPPPPTPPQRREHKPRVAPELAAALREADRTFNQRENATPVDRQHGWRTTTETRQNGERQEVTRIDLNGPTRKRSG